MSNMADKAPPPPTEASEESAPRVEEEPEEPSDPATWKAEEGPAPLTGQHHYQLVVNPYEATADLVKREELDAEAVIAPIRLEAGTSGVIVQLFKTIDVDRSGDITIEDFQKAMGEDGKDDVDAQWKKLAKYFDDDSDGIVTMSEFRLGFKGYGIEAKLDSKIGFEAPYTWTAGQWASELQSVLNRSVVDQCKILGGWFQQFDGKMAEVRSQATPDEQNADTMLMVIYMNQATELQIHRLFDLMDKDENGVLEAADFAIMANNTGTSKLWDQLKANFDANGDECITFDEFKAHLAATVRDRISVGSIPRKDWTWRQVIGRLTEWSNRMVQEQCREIYEYISYGEYGATTSEDLAEQGIAKNAVNFGCGSKLGEPAFPGGEPLPETGSSGFLADAFGAPQAPQNVAPAVFRDVHDVPILQAAPVHQGPPGMPGIPLPMAGPPVMHGAPHWWLPSAVFGLQEQMTQMDMQDVQMLRTRRDERYLQALAVLGDFGMRH